MKKVIFKICNIFLIEYLFIFECILSSLVMFIFFLHRNTSSWSIQYFFFVWICSFSIIYLCSSSWCNIWIHAVHVTADLAYHKWLSARYTHWEMASFTQQLKRIFNIDQVFRPCFFKKFVSQFCFHCFWMDRATIELFKDISVLSVCFLCEMSSYSHVHKENFPPWVIQQHIFVFFDPIYFSLDPISHWHCFF